MKKNSFLALLLLFFGTPVYSESVQIPIAIINQFFDKNQDGTIDRLPFKLNDLEEIFDQIQPVGDHLSREITKKYLSICYPEGEINILSIINSTIPKVSKEAILSSTEESILLHGSIDDLWGISPDYLSLIKARTLNISENRIDAEDIIQKAKQYKSNLSFGTYIRLRDSKEQDYLLSTPSEEHRISEVMDKTKGTPLMISFINSRCDGKKCYTEKSEGYFSSFQLSEIQTSYVKTGNKIIASCQYEGIYRREYSSNMDVEVAFSNCQLVSNNGSSVGKIHPILKKIYQDE